MIAVPVIFGFVILFTPDAEDRLFGQGRQSESGSYGQLNGKVVTRAQWMEAQNIVIGQVGEYASRLGDEFLDNRTVQVLREKALMAHYGIHPSQADSYAWISQQFDRILESLPVGSRPTQDEWFSNLFLQYGAPFRERGDSDSKVQKKGADQIDSYARHQVGANHLRSLGGVSGVLVSAREAEIKFRENNEQYEAEAIFLSHTNYLPLVQVREEQLKQHYTNTLSKHIIPERRQLSYVTFPATNYLDEAEKTFDALNEEERAGFLTNYWQGITNIAGYETNSIPGLAKLIIPVHTNEYAGMKIEEATAVIRTAILTQSQGLKSGLAVIEAYHAGVDFKESLEATHKAQPALDTLEKMALLQNLTASTTVPVSSSNNPVPGLDRGTSSQLFELSLTNAFIVGDSFSSESGDFYIASLKRIIPSRKRSFAEAKSTVTAEFKKAESIKLMQQAGEKVHQSVKGGKSLAETAKESNLAVAKLGPFDSAGGVIPGLANKANSEDFRTQALGLDVGATSELITSSTDPTDTISEEAAFVAKLTAKTAVSKDKFDAEFPTYLENERSTAAARAYTTWLQIRTEELYRYSLNTYVEGQGTINDKPNGATGFYKQGTRVKLLAKPAANFTFKEWSGAVAVNIGSATNELTVSRNSSVTASFVLKGAQ